MNPTAPNAPTAPTDEKALNRIADILAKGLKVTEDAKAPDELLDRIRKQQSMLFGWHNHFRQYADRLSQVIGAKLHEIAALGLAPDTPAAKLADAFRKGAGISFDKAMLNEFAGRSRGKPAEMNCAGVGNEMAEQFDVWNETTEAGGIVLQQATYGPQYVEPRTQPAPEGTGLRLNAYKSEWGLVAWSSESNKAQKAFIGYPMEKNRILWVGQDLNDSLLPVSKNEFKVSLQWSGLEQGESYFYNVGFALTADYQSGSGFVLRRSLVENELFIKLSQVLRSKRIKKLLSDWRDYFSAEAGTNGTQLNTVIAQAFADHRDRGDFRTAPLTPDELKAAFTEEMQKRSFELSDFNQFASKWQSMFKSYNRPNGALSTADAKQQVWLETAPGIEGYYQRVTGSSKGPLDPMRVKAGASGLLEIVLDAYLPECGTCGCFHASPPAGPVFPLLAYKLPGNRFLWISQQFTASQVDEASAIGPSLFADPSIYFVALEWIATSGTQKNCYLVEDTLKIDFANHTCETTPGVPVLKAASQL